MCKVESWRALCAMMEAVAPLEIVTAFRRLGGGTRIVAAIAGCEPEARAGAEARASGADASEDP